MVDKWNPGKVTGNALRIARGGWRPGSPGRHEGKHRPPRGFTFLEIMAVVVIIGILAGIAGVYIPHRVVIARITVCETQIKEVSVALRQFELDIGRVPDESEGLASLIEPPSSVDEESWNGPYLESDVVPVDPWKAEFRYRAPGEHRKEFDLWSAGPDRTDNTDDDIGNWTRKPAVN